MGKVYTVFDSTYVYVHVCTRGIPIQTVIDTFNLNTNQWVAW